MGTTCSDCQRNSPTYIHERTYVNSSYSQISMEQKKMNVTPNQMVWYQQKCDGLERLGKIYSQSPQNRKNNQKKILENSQLEDNSILNTIRNTTLDLNTITSDVRQPFQNEFDINNQNNQKDEQKSPQEEPHQNKEFTLNLSVIQYENHPSSQEHSFCEQFFDEKQ